jgi:hypothetical protein
MVTIGSIWGGTVRFVRGNIGAILVWSLILFATSLLSVLVMTPFQQARLAAMQNGAPAAPNLAGFFAVMLLMFATFVILWAAAFRAVLFPDDRRFFYLRVGMDELRLLGTMLVLFVGYLAVCAGGMIVWMVLVLVARVIAGDAGAGFLGIVVLIALLCGWIWALVRVSPCGPLTIYRRKVIIGPAWRLTRGAFWRLLAAYLLLFVGLFLVYGTLFAVQMGPVIGDMTHLADPAAAARLTQWQAAHNGAINGRTIAYGLLTGLIGGVALAFQAGMAGVVTRQLLGVGDATLDEVFA